MLDNTPNQPTKFRTKTWVEINYESCGTYNRDNQITVTNTAAAAAAANNANKKVIFKNCAPFTNCISRINNIQVDDV